MAKAKKFHTTRVLSARELLHAADKYNLQHLYAAEKRGDLSPAEEKELRGIREGIALVESAFAEVVATKWGGNPITETAATTAAAIPTAKERAHLDPPQWVVYVPECFPEEPENETRAQYFDRVWKQMRKELKAQAWSRGYLERRCYELELLEPRQPRAKPPTKPR